MLDDFAQKVMDWFGAEAPDPVEAPAAARARYAAFLALTFDTWVHRRTETFRFLDAYTVRRRMSVDFTLPEGRHLALGETVFVPLMILRKENLRNFDITDSDGNSLTVLTTRENGEVACRGVSLLLWAAWPEGSSPEETLKRFLEEPDLDAAQAEYGRALLEQPSPLQQALDNYPDPDPDRPEVRVIEALLEELSEGFMLMVSIPYHPGVRRHIKFSYDAAQKRVPWMSRRVRFLPSLSKILRGFSSLGLVSRLEEFGGVPIGWSQSYHAEVVPPPDIYSAETSLVPRAEDLKTVRDDHKQRPHVHIDGKRRGDKAELTLALYAEREVLIFPLLLAAIAITATLALIQHRPTTLSADTLIPVLLLPIALVAFYVRSSENSYVRKTLLGVRLIAGVPTAAGVTVAVMLGVKLIGEDGTSPRSADVASWATHASIWASTLLILALVSPVLGSIRRWVVRKTTDWTTQRAESANPADGSPTEESRKRQRRLKWLDKAISGAMTLIGVLGYLVIAVAVLWTFYAVLPIGTELPN